MKTEYMKEAYGLLFEIETGLSQYIEQTMEKTFGIGWQIKAPATMKYKPYSKHFNSFYYHELISMLRAYPCFADIPKDVYLQLIRTVPIRNKIAHCKSVNNEEMARLQDTFKLVMKYMCFAEEIISDGRNRKSVSAIH
ncbi:Swt1 family HEPN domain-containing protein [Virgibacillus xinjiangensis]|uniref:Swt1 family HEPN domain-containing protein n=1 Tax=Virgibacillus xinjiangensis TaxID=393090 RepID=A0ABV7CVN4_9BACI